MIKRDDNNDDDSLKVVAPPKEASTFSPLSAGCRGCNLFVLQVHADVPAVDHHGSIFLGSRQVGAWGRVLREGDLPCAHAGKAKQRKAGWKRESAWGARRPILVGQNSPASPPLLLSVGVGQESLKSPTFAKQQLILGGTAD